MRCMMFSLSSFVMGFPSMDLVIWKAWCSLAFNILELTRYSVKVGAAVHKTQRPFRTSISITTNIANFLANCRGIWPETCRYRS